MIYFRHAYEGRSEHDGKQRAPQRTAGTGSASLQGEKPMKQYFIASLCREGVLGGGIIADDEGITFKTYKLTVSPRFRDLKMRYEDILDHSRKRILCFAVFTISMNDGENYRFIIFSPKRFDALLTEKAKR
ncbi:MAG: hypothetical protein IJM17_04210 [Firmicutes bacterium]|nr:hypothetical protein [Bacillota bacterium]